MRRVDEGSKVGSGSKNSVSKSKNSNGLKGTLDPLSLTFSLVEYSETFRPEPKTPALREPLKIRKDSRNWVRCTSGQCIPENTCYSSFLNINALGQKGHPCYNCPLGRAYRTMRSEESALDERLDSFVH